MLSVHDSRASAWPRHLAAPAFALVGTLVLVAAAPALATDVTPAFVDGNPTCADLGLGQFEFKIDPGPFSGTFAIDGLNTVTVTSPDGLFFDWTSTLSMDAVIAKGGPNANVYAYVPESFGDTGLHPPINPSNDKPYGISHISFCYDYEVAVEKTAATTFTRTYHWSIDKSVTPSDWALFAGDAGTSQYTVGVTRTGFTDSDWAVAGDITITNPAPMDATLTGVTDAVSPAIGVAVDCGVTFPYSLGSGQTLTCTYSSPLPDGTARINTAAVTTTGSVGPGSASADVVFGAPTSEVDATVHVTDSNGSSWTFADTGSQSYLRTFVCDGDAGSHPNVATIVETGQSDDAHVSVTCYDLEVTKDAHTRLTRSWTYDPAKSADRSELTLSPGQQLQVNYTVVVSATSEDRDWAVDGGIWIHNTNPLRDAVLTAVTDRVSPGVPATVSCPAAVVPAGGTLHCTYTATLPDGAPQTNTATASLQNVSVSPDGTAAPGGTTDFSGRAAVDFAAAAVTEIDACGDVDDSNLDPPAPNLGTVCAADLPQTFAYSRMIGPYETPDGCGDQTVDNTATVTAADTGASREDTWTVLVHVPCDLGCTLTPGYWKTHSTKGPAPYDDTWVLIGPAQEDTPFFLSGQTYHEVLWTAPRGNAYYILAHAWIAAQLNQLNGASIPADVLDVDGAAAALLATHTPEDVAALKGKGGLEERAVWLGYATILDDYNNGFTGPGHCSE